MAHGVARGTTRWGVALNSTPRAFPSGMARAPRTIERPSLLCHHTIDAESMHRYADAAKRCLNAALSSIATPVHAA